MSKDCAKFRFVFKARQETRPPWRIGLFTFEVLTPTSREKRRMDSDLKKISDPDEIKATKISLGRQDLQDQ